MRLLDDIKRIEEEIVRLKSEISRKNLELERLQSRLEHNNLSYVDCNDNITDEKVKLFYSYFRCGLDVYAKRAGWPDKNGKINYYAQMVALPVRGRE